MTDPADYEMRTPPTWARDVGALRAVADYLSQVPGHGATPEQVAEWAGLDVDLTTQALERWESAEPPVFTTYHIEESLLIRDLTGEGRRVTGLWPSPDQIVDDLVDALEQAARAEPDEQKRSGLLTTARFVGSAARDLVVGVVAAKYGPMLPS